MLSDVSVNSSDFGKMKAEMRALWARGFPRLMGDAGKVVLAGDSVLDNFIWLANPRRSLRVVMEERLAALQHGLICVNLAVDQTSSFDFLYRTCKENSWARYQRGRRVVYNQIGDDVCDKDGYRHLTASDGVIRSHVNISALKNVHYIFLSVGGNDVYLSASVQTRLARSLLPFCDVRHQVADEYESRLSQCISELKRAQPEAVIVPVICYHPHHRFSISGLGSVGCYVQRKYLRWMVTPMVSRVLRIAEREAMNVIDLSQTFDPTNVRHYGDMSEGCGWSGAEPSDVSQEFIADLMEHVIKQGPPAPGKSPKVVWGRPEGDTLPERNIHSMSLTPDTVSRYTFHEGFAKKSANSKFLC